VDGEPESVSRTDDPEDGDDTWRGKMGKKRYSVAALAAVAVITACSPEGEATGEMTSAVNQVDLEPPVAAVRPQELEKHDVVRVDEYYWLNQRDDPEVVEYLDAENAYTEAVMAHTEALQGTLFDEIKGRIKQDDASVPYLYGGYFYYMRFEEGKEYPIYARKNGSLAADEEVMVDGNQMAEGHEYFAASVGSRGVSPDESILAFATDTIGRRIYTIRFKNLETGELLDDEIPSVTPVLAWGNDNRTLFYTKQDPTTLRYYQVWRHELGTPVSDDVLVYEETDDTFDTYVLKTKSNDYLLIASSQTISDEYRYLDANDPTGEFTILQPRERGLEYSVDQFGDRFYIRTNLDARNFRLMRTPVTATGKANWEEVLPHRDDVLLEDVDIFSNWLVVSERRGGLMEIRVMSWDGSEDYYVDFGEPAYLAYTTANFGFDTDELRYGYTSMTTPNSVFDYDMISRDKELLKQDEVLGGFKSDDYVTERVYATAGDGTQVPVSIVYRRGTPIDGTAPLLQYGYGSYGASMDATFSAARLSLLDRGFVYAIAHVRGGEELGRAWYEDGKLLNKKNTFTDFIDVTRYLVAEDYADPDRVFAMGGSAGGLLMGAVVNMAPELYRGVIAAVPFVDVVTTMLDESIPLTTSEYDEWGDPNDKEYFDYILSYSPYENVDEKDYPNLLVTTGLHDSQVQYWEPAKWVARLRTRKTDDNVLILKTNMDAGHGGASGRYKRYEETAFMYAFLIDLADAGN
jgi:oligopeptidase B